jgi:hypothetical protein
MRQMLFKVSCPSGREYVIYDNGEIQGFEDGAIIFNNYPQLLASEIQSVLAQAVGKQTSITPSLPATALTADLEGASHPMPA